MRTAVVRLGGRRVGLLQEREGGWRFQYDSAWLARTDAVAVSLTMPLCGAPYDSRGPHPWFVNLLPEGWLLDLSVAKLKVARDDVFGLLCSLCRDCHGAVEIFPGDDVKTEGAP